MHKLIALATLILIGKLIFNLQKNIKLETGIIFLIVLSILSVLALFVSGALLSAGNIPHLIAKAIHIIASTTVAISIGMSIYLLLKKR